MATLKVSRTVLTRSVNIGVGLGTSGASVGLFLADISGRAFSLLYLGYHCAVKNLRDLFADVRWADIKSAIVNFKNYPLMIMPASYIDALSTGSMIYLISYAYGSEAVGCYAYTRTLLAMPIVLIAGNLKRVFLKKAVDIQNENPERLGVLLGQIIQKLLIACALPLLLFSAYAPELFSIVFSEKWKLAG